MDDANLEGASAIVTGASAGIGAATARALAAAGANVALAARRENRLETLADELGSAHGVDALSVPTDVGEEAQVAKLVEETVDRFGGLDVVVSNAGVGLGGDVASMTTEQYRTMQVVNVDGTFFLTRAALPHLVESRGHLIVVGSFAGKYPRPFNPVYAATKWWVRGFAHSVMGQVGDDGVAVTVVNPSEVRTEFGSEEGRPFEERFEPGEVVEPEEVAAAIRFAAERPGATASEIDVNRRDKFVGF